MFCLENLVHLTIEKVQDFMRSIAIPECIGCDGKEMSTELFLKQCSLENVSQPTVYRWMKLLGFSYCDRHKTYYVDGHERDDVIKYHTDFCTRYLSTYEPHCMRWVQIPKSIASTYDELKCCGYTFMGTDNVEMCEYHINDLPKELASTCQCNMSVRAGPNSLPIMIIGQDECVFSQFLLTSKMWVGPHKEAPLLPKSDGEGRMISAMQSRDFGFGLRIPEDKLAQINESRREKKYLDTTAATEIFGCI